MPSHVTAGSWKPGQSGNPGGRVGVLAEIRELARQKTPKAVEALVEALACPGERVAAATILLAYGYGRPIQAVAVDANVSVTDERPSLAVLLGMAAGTAITQEAVRLALEVGVEIEGEVDAE